MRRRATLAPCRVGRLFSHSCEGAHRIARRAVRIGGSSRCCAHHLAACRGQSMSGSSGSVISSSPRRAAAASRVQSGSARRRGRRGQIRWSGTRRCPCLGCSCRPAPGRWRSVDRPALHGRSGRHCGNSPAADSVPCRNAESLLCRTDLRLVGLSCLHEYHRRLAAGGSENGPAFRGEGAAGLFGNLKISCGVGPRRQALN